MESLEKVVYETPAVQVVEVASENAICSGSGDSTSTPGHGNGYGYWY